MPPSARDQSVYPYDVDQVRAMLKDRQSRRGRGIRSCFPCRHRKVRCDGQSPCSNCQKRDHSELCRLPTALNGSTSEQRGQQSQFEAERGSQVANIYTRPSVSQEDVKQLFDFVERIEDQLASFKAMLTSTITRPSNSPAVPPPSGQGNAHREQGQGALGRYCVEDVTGATVFLGSRSDTPLTLGCRDVSCPETRGIPQEDMVAQFVPRAFPFINLWAPNVEVDEVCRMLPEDSDLIRYWQTYQTYASPFYPILVNEDEFSSSLFTFLEWRSSKGREGQGTPQPETSWLALLFAVLACAVVYSDDPVQDRDLRSRVFISSSFQCLRMANFLKQPNIDQIQAMALIGHCLRNDLETNSAWILVGTTVRVAQSIGLHEESSTLSLTEQNERNRLWWTVVWQDTLLSFSYDRPPSGLIANSRVPCSKSSGFSFQECIFTMCQIITWYTKDQAVNTDSRSLQHTLDCKQKLEEIFEKADVHLQSKANCKSLQQHLDRLALGVNMGYAICRLCRDVLHEMPLIRDDCISRGLQAIESFIDLHRLSAKTCRNWAFVHNAVSCAITINEIDARQTNKQVVPMMHQILHILKKEDDLSKWYDEDANERSFGPYSRYTWALALSCDDTLSQS